MKSDRRFFNDKKIENKHTHINRIRWFNVQLKLCLCLTDNKQPVVFGPKFKATAPKGTYIHPPFSKCNFHLQLKLPYACCCAVLCSSDENKNQENRDQEFRWAKWPTQFKIIAFLVLKTQCFSAFWFTLIKSIRQLQLRLHSKMLHSNSM